MNTIKQKLWQWFPALLAGAIGLALIYLAR
jgi:hypothetical protein